MTIKFPLQDDERDALKNSYEKVGFIQLSNGTATIYDNRINRNSVGLVSYKTFSGTTGTLRIECLDGQAVITSSSNTDTSVVYYRIVF